MSDQREEIMKIVAMTALVVIAAGWARAGEPDDRAAERKVTVCMNGDTIDFVAALRTKEIASKMFSGIGVTLDWRRSCSHEGILISLSSRTLPEQMPHAFAYALPYEGKHIVIFYDRVKQASDSSRLPSLLAHVVVHEITHLLQGFDRHSFQGVMKANWDGGDYSEMTWNPLAFTAEDIDLIYRGLAGRPGRAAGGAIAASSENRVSSDAILQ
jgi:hypothetical protein